MSSNNLEQESNSKVVEVAYNMAAMTGQFWGSIFASIVNVSSDYANVTYNCAKIASEKFKDELDPAVKKMMSKIDGSDDSSGNNFDKDN